MSLAKFFQRYTKVRKIESLRKRIILPAFSHQCGPAINTALSAPPYAFVEPTIAASNLGNLTTAFTIEAWLRPLGLPVASVDPGFSVIEKHHSGSPGAMQWCLYYYDNGTVGVKVDTGGAPQDNTSVTVIPKNTWTHVAVTYDNANVKVYVNGLLESTTAYAGPLCSGNDAIYIMGGLYSSPARIEVDRIAVWSTTRTAQEILNHMMSPISGNETGLVMLFNFDEGSGIATEETVTATSLIVPAELKWTDGAPFEYGSSFVCAEYAFSGVGGYFSFKYPITKPTGANFTAVVKWVEDGVVTRYALWPYTDKILGNPLVYTGQRIPTSGIIEIWNTDGESYATLSADLTLYVSPLTIVDSEATTDGDLIATLVADTTLAAPFPWTFPVSFNTQQTY